MIRTPFPARTPATASLVALTLALSAAPAVANPLGDAISPQYHDVATTALAAAAAGSETVPAPVPAVPAPQYHNNSAGDNSEPVTENVPAPAVAPPAEPAAPPAREPTAPPAPEPTAPTAPERAAPVPPAPPVPPVPPAPASDTPAPAIDPVPVPAAPADDPAPVPAPHVTLAPAVVSAPTAAPRVESAPRARVRAPVVELPAVADAFDAVLPAVATGGNTNVSIRIFSPGDDGPVVQGGGGATSPGSTIPAPVTWNWNWNWTGAADCDPGGAANAAPPVGLENWTWNWTWSCDPIAVVDPTLIASVVDPEALVTGALPELPAGLRPEALVPEVAVADEVASGPHATAIPSRRRSHDVVAPAPGAGAVMAAASGPTPPATTSLAAFAPAPRAAPHRAAARNRRGDTTGYRRAISPRSAPAGASSAVAGGIAAAAGAAGGPAVLATLISLLACFLVRALLPAVGLPRSLLRGARLERPG